GGRRGSLLDTLDQTRTPMGARLLGGRLGQPLTDPAAIDARLDRVAYFVADGVGRAATREVLRELPDLERILGRVVAAGASPRDLAALRRGLEALPKLIAVAGLTTPSGDREATHVGQSFSLTGQAEGLTYKESLTFDASAGPQGCE